MDKKEERRPNLNKVIEVLEGVKVKRPYINVSEGISDKRINETISEISRFIVETATPKRNDRLFPAHSNMVNPLNISFGALGVAVTLQKINGTVPSDFTDWILNHEVTENEYPPSLYLGLSGIAWAFTLLNETNLAKKTLEKPGNTRFYINLLIYTGIAGYDLTNLHFWMVTKEDKYLNEAIKIGNELIEKRTKNQSGCFWPSPEGTVFIGYLNCSSGIALFLLYLYQVTNERLS